MAGDAVSTVATVALAVVAAAALGMNLWQMRLTRQALTAALESVNEARRARIDTRSPRVVVHEAPPPVWPAAEAQSLVAAGRNPLTTGTRFDLPGDAHRRVVLSTYIHLYNEGETTAFLTLPPGGIKVANHGDRPPDAGEEVLKWSQGHPLGYQLSPQLGAWFLLESGFSIEEWATRWRTFDGKLDERQTGEEPDTVIPGVRFAIEITDQFVQSFRDTLIVDVVSLPIEPYPGSADSWLARTTLRTTLDEFARVRVIGVRRSY